MSTQQSSDRTSPAELATLTRSIACVICHAVYSPTQEHMYLIHAPASALETAFMSMSHFCFRCRRPSCPACWDHVHGVCASCVQEMRLPFREELSPLRGTFFPPMRHAQETRVNTSAAPLDCIQPGQFQQLDHPAIDSATTGPMKAITTASVVSTASTQSPETRPEAPATKSTVPAQVASSAPPASSNQSDLDIDKLKTKPERDKDSSKSIERIVTIVLLVVLLMVVAVIVIASLSVSANAFIATVLHIDIRAEVAYLWQIVTHLFS